jgi:hypothetical protein
MDNINYTNCSPCAVQTCGDSLNSPSLVVQVTRWNTVTSFLRRTLRTVAEDYDGFGVTEIPAAPGVLAEEVLNTNDIEVRNYVFTFECGIGA